MLGGEERRELSQDEVQSVYKQLASKEDQDVVKVTVHLSFQTPVLGEGEGGGEEDITVSRRKTSAVEQKRQQKPFSKCLNGWRMTTGAHGPRGPYGTWAQVPQCLVLDL